MKIITYLSYQFIMYMMNVSVGLAPAHKMKRKRGNFCSSQLPLLSWLISAERSMEFICAPYLRDGLSDLVLRLICSRVCGTCLLLSPLLCWSCQGLVSSLLLMLLISNISKVVAVGRLTKVEICMLWMFVTAEMHFYLRAGAAKHQPACGYSWGRQSVIWDFRV